MKKLKNRNITTPFDGIIGKRDFSNDIDVSKSSIIVLFVENTGSRNIQIKDLNRVKNRILNFIKSKKGFKILNQNLTLFTYLTTYFHFNFFIQKIIYHIYQIQY